VKKTSKAKRKTTPKAGSAGASAKPRSARTSRTPRARQSRASSAPRRSRIAAVPRSPAPLVTYSREERNALALLLVPFLLMTFALGAAQILAPKDSSRRQLALLPEPQTVSAAAAPIELSFPPPEVATLIDPQAQVVAATIAQTANLIEPEAGLEPLPPGGAVVARLAADKCVAPSRRSKPGYRAAIAAASPSAFGLMLASAARAQTDDLVVYSDTYRQIGFPMGDVPSLYGVCTDVVVRAYRALGVDLQVLVHEAGLGTGDTSIDHRRTQTLRRFFARYGVSLPVTDFVEDYRPGDIVTYHRATGRTSQSHIAIVSDVIAPSGRPMIVHNRGWGPQLEDALFASDMTGHYRFATPEIQAALDGAPPVARPVAQSPMPARMRLSATTVP